MKLFFLNRIIFQIVRHQWRRREYGTQWNISCCCKQNTAEVQTKNFFFFRQNWSKICA